MIHYPLQTFGKITALPGLLPALRYRLHRTADAPKNRYAPLENGGILVANHRTIMDGLFLAYVYYFREVRILAAEVLYRKNKPFSWLLRNMGFIRVERTALDLFAVQEAGDTLRKKGVLVLFPEGRLPLPHEKGSLLPFQPGAVMLSQRTGVPIIPMYIRGNYIRQTVDVLMGAPLYAKDLLDPDLPYTDALRKACETLRQHVASLGARLDEEYPPRRG